MILEKLLMPDEVYSSFEELTPEHMKELGKKYIFSDIDNTLATYDDMYPPENVKKWCARMAENGGKVQLSFRIRRLLKGRKTENGKAEARYGRIRRVGR